ncbi:MAG: Verru_Chthon cassette protein D [Verrucomicrobiota bacterium]
MRAFTLLEITIVMLVVAILFTLAVPALQEHERSSRLADSADRLVRLFRLARQHAMTGNRNTQVRFYRFEDPNVPGSIEAFRAARLTTPSEDGETGDQISGLFLLPTRMVITDGEEFSSMFSLGEELTERDFPTTGGSTVDYVGIEFRANGTIDGSPSARYFLTLWDENRAVREKPPKDYATIQVDPVSGGVDVFRP